LNDRFEDLNLTPEAQAYLREIEKNLKSDLAAPANLYYSHEVFEELSQTALKKLKTRLSQLSTPVDLEALRSAWRETVMDYYKSNNWGFQAQTIKPPRILTEDDKVRKELWPYIWVVIQSMIILKTVVYYFGIQASDDPSTLNKVLLCLALGTSAFTLIFFAWRKSRK
jgi:hypothetical protein